MPGSPEAGVACPRRSTWLLAPRPWSADGAAARWRAGFTVALLLLAALLRAGRALARWEEVSIAYSAYQAPLVQALEEPGRLLGTWVGLHPPLYGLCYALLERTAPRPILFLGFSALCSWLAVLAAWRAAHLLGGERAGLVALALASTAPVALHYAAEVNDYPLLQALLAGLLWAWARYRTGLSGWMPVSLLGIAAGWTHVLGGLAAGIVAVGVLARHRGDGLRCLLVLALGAAPVVAGALALLGEGDTFGQPPLRLDLSVADWVRRFSWLCLPALALGLPALRRVWLPAALWLGIAGATVGMILVGVAAPHQFPYWSLLMPAGAVLVGLASARIRGWWALALALAVAQGAWVVPEEWARLGRIWRDQARPRAVDLALAEAEPGDGLWLLSPALEPDDDKRAVSPTLWRLRPWRPMPMVAPFPMEYTDYRYGQPRAYGDLTFYTFTDLWPDRMDAILRHHTEAGHRVFIVVYDYSPAQAFLVRLHRLLRPWASEERAVGTDEGLGVDHLLVVSGRAAPGVP
ncbi:MAG: hypothetical protein ABIO70_37225 [Pseudomonadota bacterium]